MTAKQRILDAAFAELERSGIDGFSLRAAGVAAGYTPMAVYRHYRNREELLEAVGGEAFLAWKRRVDAVPAAAAIDWLLSVARDYIEFALDEPARFDACFVLKTRVERLYPQDFAAGKSPVITMVMQYIAGAQASGDIAPGDPLELALLLWAELHGLAMLHRSGRFSMGRRAFLDLCMRCAERVLVNLSTDPSNVRSLS